MERDLIQADRLQDQLKMKNAALAEIDLNRLIQVYQKIAAKSPALEGSGDIGQAPDEKKQAWAIGSLAISRIGTLYLDQKIYDKAFDSFKSVADNPTTTPTQKNAIVSYMALSLEKLGRYREASAIYDSLALGYLAIMTPENPNLDALDAPIKAAEMCMRSGDSDLYRDKMNRAETYYKSIINTHEGTLLEAAAIGKLSGAYLQQTRFADAIEILQTVLDDSSGFTSPTIFLTIADIYMNRLRDFRSAENTYRDFLKYYPKNENAPTAQLGLGLSLFEQTRYADARKAVQGIENIPRIKQNLVAQAFFLMALCYEKEDKWELAKVQFDLVQSSFIGTEHAFETALHVPAYYRNRGMTDLAKKAFESSVRYIEKYAEENIANPVASSKARGYLVRAYTENQDYINAADQLTILHNLFPQLPEGKLAPLRLGEIYETVIYDTTKAIDWLRIFVRENPEAANINDIKNHIQNLESRIGKTSAGG
jgi:tetratricopeptide (TPR) repeat protein